MESKSFPLFFRGSCEFLEVYMLSDLIMIVQDVQVDIVSDGIILWKNPRAGNQ